MFPISLFITSPCLSLPCPSLTPTNNCTQTDSCHTLIFLMGFFCFGHPHFLNNLVAPWRVGLCAHKGPCGLPRPTPGADSCSGGTSNSGVPCGKPQPAGQSGNLGPGQVSSVIPDSSRGAICIMALNNLVGEATGSFHKPKAYI